MNQIRLAPKARDLYQIEHSSADEIAHQLGISRRTVFNWIKKFDWNKPLPKPLQLYELQTAASVMLKSLERDTEGKFAKITINEMLKFFDYVLEEEKKEAKRQKENPPPKGLTPERVKEIQWNILGMDV
jgi:predicted DNA-binding protein YlxM (UPF0122 family)